MEKIKQWKKVISLNAYPKIPGLKKLSENNKLPHYELLFILSEFKWIFKKQCLSLKSGLWISAFVLDILQIYICVFNNSNSR